VPTPFLALATWIEAFQLMLRHARVLLGQIIVLLGLTFLSGMLVGLVFVAAGDGDARAIEATAQLIGTIIGLAISTNIWIGVGRLAIRNEPPSIAGLFKWGKRQWRMLSIGLLCALLLFGPLLLLGLLVIPFTGVPMHELPFGSAAGFTFAVVVLLGLAWFLYIMAKVAFTGPIIADDGPSGSLSQSWQMSRRHTLKLTGGIVLTILIMIIGELILLSPAFLVGAAIHNSIYSELVNTIGSTIGGVWIMAFASLAYVKLRGSAPA
jgi:hypothetical protein